jgi:SAM-dependent methyltransferase
VLVREILSVAKKDGWNTTGIEPVKEQSIAIGKGISFVDNTSDLILLMCTMWHVRTCTRFRFSNKRIKRLLKPTGTLSSQCLILNHLMQNTMVLLGSL